SGSVLRSGISRGGTGVVGQASQVNRNVVLECARCADGCIGSVVDDDDFGGVAELRWVICADFRECAREFIVAVACRDDEGELHQTTSRTLPARRMTR